VLHCGDTCWQVEACAGINDFGGISPITRDYVNPELSWPHLRDLSAACADKGKVLMPRLPIYPEFLQEPEQWLSDKPASPALDVPPVALPGPEFAEHYQAVFCMSPRAAVLRTSDASGFARACSWYAGKAQDSNPYQENVLSLSTHGELIDPEPSNLRHSTVRLVGEAPVVPTPRKKRWRVERAMHGALEGHVTPPVNEKVQRVLQKHASVEYAAGYLLGDGGAVRWEVDDVVTLLTAYGSSAEAVVQHADDLRQKRCGNDVSYVVNRNINYTNVRSHLTTQLFPEHLLGVLHAVSMHPAA
jgi:FO synthase